MGEGVLRHMEIHSADRREKSCKIPINFYLKCEMLLHLLNTKKDEMGASRSIGLLEHKCGVTVPTKAAVYIYFRLMECICYIVCHTKSEMAKGKTKNSIDRVWKHPQRIDGIT